MEADDQRILSERLASLGESVKQTLDTLAASRVVEDLEKIRVTLTMLHDDFEALSEDVKVALGDPPAEVPDAVPRSPPSAPEP
jgi:hypothetical protein